MTHPRGHFDVSRLKRLYDKPDEHRLANQGESDGSRPKRFRRAAPDPGPSNRRDDDDDDDGDDPFVESDGERSQASESIPPVHYENDSEDSPQPSSSDSNASGYTILHDRDRPFPSKTVVFQDERIIISIQQRKLHHSTRFGLEDHAFVLLVRPVARPARQHPLIKTLVGGLWEAIATAVDRVKQFYAESEPDAELFVSLKSARMVRSINGKAMHLESWGGGQAAGYVLSKFENYLQSDDDEPLRQLHVNFHLFLDSHVRDRRARGIKSARDYGIGAPAAANERGSAKRRKVDKCVLRVPAGTRDNPVLYKGLCIPISVQIANAYRKAYVVKRRANAPPEDGSSEAKRSRFGETPQKEYIKLLDPTDTSCGLTLYGNFIREGLRGCNVRYENWAKTNLQYKEVLPSLSKQFNVSICVFKLKPRAEVITRYPEIGANMEKPILYLLESTDDNGVRHCDPVIDILTLQAEICQPCYLCGRAVNVGSKLRRHRCSKETSCGSCLRILQKANMFYDSNTEELLCCNADGTGAETGAEAECGRCNRITRSPMCAKHHATVCRRAFRCKQCDKVVEVRGPGDRANHLCGEWYCRRCLNQATGPRSEHQCLVRRCRQQLRWDRLGFVSFIATDSAVCLDCDLNSQMCAAHADKPMAEECQPAVIAYCRETDISSRGVFDRSEVLCSSFLERADFELGASNLTHLPASEPYLSETETSAEKTRQKQQQKEERSRLRALRDAKKGEQATTRAATKKRRHEIPSGTAALAAAPHMSCADTFIDRMLSEDSFRNTTVFVHCDDRNVCSLSSFLRAAVMAGQVPQVRRVHNRLTCLIFRDRGVRLIDTASYFVETIAELGEQLDPQQPSQFFPSQLSRRSAAHLTMPWEELSLANFLHCDDGEASEGRKKAFLSRRQRNGAGDEWNFREEIITTAVHGMRVIARSMVARFSQLYALQESLFDLEAFGFETGRRRLLSPFSPPFVSIAGFVFHLFKMVSSSRSKLHCLSTLESGVDIGGASRSEIRLAIELAIRNPSFEVRSALSERGQFRPAKSRDAAIPDIVLIPIEGGGPSRAVFLDGCSVHGHADCARFGNKEVNFKGIPVAVVRAADARKRQRLQELCPTLLIEQSWECDVIRAFESERSKEIWKNHRRPSSRLNPREA